MPVVRCQACGIPISAHCVRCPQCLSRSPTVRRVSVAGAFAVLLVALYLLMLFKLTD